MPDIIQVMFLTSYRVAMDSFVRIILCMGNFVMLCTMYNNSKFKCERIK